MNKSTERMILASGRSWWSARYYGGKVLNEWDTPPGVPHDAIPDATRWRESRWEEVEKRGIVALTLFTPTGIAAVLEARSENGKTDIDGRRFFQLKVGRLNVQMRSESGDIAVMGRQAEAHIIGYIQDDLSAGCAAYERSPHAYTPRGDDAAYVSATGDLPRCGTCNLPRSGCAGRDMALQIEQVLREWVPDPAFPLRVHRSREPIATISGVPRQIVRFTDYPDDMQYRKIGPLNLAVQGTVLN